MALGEVAQQLDDGLVGERFDRRISEQIASVGEEGREACLLERRCVVHLGGLEGVDDVDGCRVCLRDPAEVVLHLVIQIGHIVLVGQGQELVGVFVQVGVGQLLGVEILEKALEYRNFDVRQDDLFGGGFVQALAEQRDTDP